MLTALKLIFPVNYLPSQAEPLDADGVAAVKRVEVPLQFPEGRTLWQQKPQPASPTILRGGGGGGSMATLGCAAPKSRGMMAAFGWNAPVGGPPAKSQYLSTAASLGSVKAKKASGPGGGFPLPYFSLAAPAAAPSHSSPMAPPGGHVGGAGFSPQQDASPPPRPEAPAPVGSGAHSGPSRKRSARQEAREQVHMTATAEDEGSHLESEADSRALDMCMECDESLAVPSYEVKDAEAPGAAPCPNKALPPDQVLSLLNVCRAADGSVPATNEVLEALAGAAWEKQHQQTSRTLSEAAAELLRPPSAGSRPPLLDDRAWATVLALAYLRKHLGSERGVWGDMEAKALAWLNGVWPAAAGRSVGSAVLAAMRLV